MHCWNHHGDSHVNQVIIDAQVAEIASICLEISAGTYEKSKLIS